MGTSVDCRKLSCNIRAFGIITVYDNMHIREDSTQTATGKQNIASQDRKPSSHARYISVFFLINWVDLLGTTRSRF